MKKKSFLSACPLSASGEGWRRLRCRAEGKISKLQRNVFLMPIPIQAARALRQQMTPEEKLLWQNLRALKDINSEDSIP